MTDFRLPNGAKARQLRPEPCPFCGIDTGIIRDPNAYTSDKLREHNIKARDIDFITRHTVIDNTEVRTVGILDTKEREEYLQNVDERKKKNTGIGDYGYSIVTAKRMKKSIIVVLVIDKSTQRCCYKLGSSTMKYKDLAEVKWKGPVDDKIFFKKLAEIDENERCESKRTKTTKQSKRYVSNAG